MSSASYLVLLLSIMSLSLACNIQGCAGCNSQVEVCMACAQNYQLTLLGNCVRDTIQNCASYLDASTCVKCRPTYKLSGNTCKRDYSGCVMNISQSRCGTCLQSLTNVDGKCTGTINCQTYEMGVCVACEMGFTLQNGGCLASTNNCLTVNATNGICQTCKQGYQLVGYRCVERNRLAQHCWLYGSNGGCLTCKQGFKGENGACVLGDGLIKGNNVPSVQQTATMGGQNQGNVNTQQQSESLGQSQSIAPSSAPPNQQISTTSSSTTQQNLETILSRLNVQCSAWQGEICKECYPSNYLDYDGVCKAISTLCSTFNHQTRTCQACYPGYMLNNINNCVVAPPDNKDPRCRVFEGPTCRQCFNQFHLYNGICTANNPLCKTINSDGSCSSCYFGYLLANGACLDNKLASDPFCLNSQNGQCLLCAHGYYVSQNQNKCVPKPLGCQDNDPSGACTSCMHQYVLLNGACIVAIANCQTYTLTGECSSCQPGYFTPQSTNRVCYPKDITCQAYDAYGNCLACVVTYHLFKGQCIFPALGFDVWCSEYKNSYCVACKEGSVLENYKCRRV